jgi:hypothetical protein
MDRVYRGWLFTKLAEEDGEMQYRAVKHSEIIVGAYDACRYEIDIRELERARRDYEDTDR